MFILENELENEMQEEQDKFQKFLYYWLDKLSLRERFKRFEFHTQRIKYPIIIFKKGEDRAILYLPNLETDFTIIHELGHPFLVEKYGNYRLAGSNEIPKSMEPFYGVLLDSFVNYHICKIPEAYELYIPDSYHALAPDTRKGTLEYSDDFNDNLKDYIYKFISINFILKKKDYEPRKNRIETYLRDVRNILKEKVNLDLLDSQLKVFNKVKNSPNPDKILNFIYKVLAFLPIFKHEELRELKIVLGI